MCYLRQMKKLVLLTIVMGLMFFLSSPLGAQGFSPYFNPFLYYGNPYYGFGFAPAIRTTNPYLGYGTAFGAPWLTPSFTPPAPIFRSAAATITLWVTTGTANTLLIYNPTSLIGASAAPVTPSPLLSLIAGNLLVFGHSALSTTNPLFYNYLVNTYLLPTGLATFAIP